MTGRFSLRISGGGVSPVALMLVTVAMWASAPLVVALLDVSGAPFLFAVSMEAGALLAYLAFLLLFHRSLLGDPQVLRVLGRQLLLRDRRLAWLLLGVVSGLAYVFFIAGGMRVLFGGGGLEVLLGGSLAFLGSLLTVVAMASSVLWVRRVERRLSPELCSRLGHPGVVLCSVFFLMVLSSSPWALLSLSLRSSLLVSPAVLSYGFFLFLGGLSAWMVNVVGRSLVANAVIYLGAPLGVLWLALTVGAEVGDWGLFFLDMGLVVGVNVRWPCFGTGAPGSAEVQLSHQFPEPDDAAPDLPGVPVAELRELQLRLGGLLPGRHGAEPHQPGVPPRRRPGGAVPVLHQPFP